MSGRKVTLAELGARHVAQAKLEQATREAWHQTPEGKAWLAQQEKLAQADSRAWAAHMADPFARGREAAEAGGEREPPAEFEGEAEELWLAGFDSMGED